MALVFRLPFLVLWVFWSSFKLVLCQNVVEDCAWVTLSHNLTSHRYPGDIFSPRIAPLTSTIDRLPVFWINLDRNTDRRAYMEAYLESQAEAHGLGRLYRVPAITPDDPRYRIKRVEKPCKRNTPHDLAIILSHLTAIHTAVYEKDPITKFGNFNDPNGYALILEDDIKFNMKLDFRELISLAPRVPRSFGILQLVTTNVEALKHGHDRFMDSQGHDFWSQNFWYNKTRNGRYPLYWGAMGYIIHKPTMKAMLSKIIEEDEVGNLHFKIINSFNENNCKFTTERPCVLANCLFSDTFVYSAGEPTYVANVPIVTNGALGTGASMTHKNHIQAHKHAFQLIDNIRKSFTETEDYKKCVKYFQQREK